MFHKFILHYTSDHCLLSLAETHCYSCDVSGENSVTSAQEVIVLVVLICLFGCLPLC